MPAHARSIQALPAAVPEPQFGIGPPQYSISWDLSPPSFTAEPEEPEESEYPAPTPSDQISLSPPTATVSWDGSPIPTEIPEDGIPEYPEDPELHPPSPSDAISLSPPIFSVSWDGPELPKPSKEPWRPRPPKPTHKTRSRKSSSRGHVSATISWGRAQVEVLSTPTNGISLHPPSYSLSWDGPRPPKPTKKPHPPIPTRKTSTNGYVSASVSWAKRQDFSYSISWDGPQPPKPTRKPWWPPAWTSTDGYVSASVTWNKRQEEGDPEPTDPPGFPEGPDLPAEPEESDPVSFPGPPAFTPPNSIGIQPPQVSFSWGKRQEEEPEPTTFPDPEDPEDPESPISLPVAPSPTPHNSIGIQPPQVSFSWGKRQDDEDPGPTEIPVPSASTPSDQFSVVQPTVSISWVRRQDDEDPTPTEIPAPPALTPSDQITLVQPTASISWGKREPEAQAPTWGIGFPTFSWGFPPVFPSSAYVSWGKRDDDKRPNKPTTFQTSITRPQPTITPNPSSVANLCPTVTKTVIPPCVPPTCPRGLISCKVAEAKVLEIEKTIVTVTTFAKVAWRPTPTKNVCTTGTVLVNVGCPTWTCVPGGCVRAEVRDMESES